MGRLRVLFVSHNLKREGAQLVVTTIARLLHAPEKLDVKVLGLGPGDLEGELRADGVECAAVAAATAAEQVDAVKAAAEAHRADVVVVNTAMLHPVVASFPAGSAPRLVWAVHESDVPTLYRTLPGFEAAVAGGILEQHPTVFVCDASLREYLGVVAAARGPAAEPTFRRVYNGIDVAAVDRVGSQTDRAAVRRSLFPGLSDDAVLCITVGTPKPRKGQLGVAEAVCAVRGRVGTDVACVVVGVGGTDEEYEQKLRDCAAGAPQGCGVALVGRGGQEHVFRHLAAADVYVCNSTIESFPLGILEAMAFALPVVSTDINGIPEQVVDGKTGVLYPQGDQSALEAAVERLASDKATRHEMGSVGRRRVETDFSIGAMADSWLQLIREFAQ